MAIGVLVKVLLLSGTVAGGGAGGRPPPKNKKGLQEWIRNKLKALSYLLGRLRVKLAEVLSGITGAIISWILNEAAECWVSQNLWALVVGIGGLLYAYMVTKKKESYHDTS